MTILFDYWAPWCPPCKAMNPIIDEIEKEFPAVRVERINIDENTDAAQVAGVLSIPTYIIVKTTDDKPDPEYEADAVMEETHRFIGIVNKQTLVDALK